LPVALQLHAKKPTVGLLHRIVAVDPGGLVNVIDSKIEIAVEVEVGIGGSAGESLLGNPPIFTLLLERQVSRVPKRVVRHRGRGDFVDQIVKLRILLLPPYRRKILGILKIHIGVVIPDSIRNIEVLEPIEVEVSQKSRPAPISI